MATTHLADGLSAPAPPRGILSLSPRPPRARTEPGEAAARPEPVLTPVALTLRLFDAVPDALLGQWQGELAVVPRSTAADLRRRRVEAALDAGHGERLLRKVALGALVERLLLRHDLQRYELHAWVVMPSHVHVLMTPAPGVPLVRVLRSWTTAIEFEANRYLERTGAFWHREIFNRPIRDQAHREAAAAYIERDPVRARLCRRPEDWPFSSAHRRAGAPLPGGRA